MIKVILKYIIPNLIIILSGIILVCMFLDTLNPTMNFLDNVYSMMILKILCFITIFHSIYLILLNKSEKQEIKKEKREIKEKD